MLGSITRQPSHHLSRKALSLGWSRDHAPALIVPSGAEILVDAPDCSNGQVAPGATAEVIERIDWDQVDLISGPVFVEGAHPDDVLQVDILGMELGHYGYSANYPGAGLLPEDFPDAWIYIWELGGERAPYLDGISVPIEPMIGIAGCTPAAPGVHSAIPPLRTGGNLDAKHIGPGTTLYLPVEVEGALFGAGDPHGAQGDGEVGGSGIETAAKLHLRLTVRHDLRLDTPEYEVRRPLERASAAAAGYYVTTGIGTDLYAASKAAVRRMIDHITRITALEPVAAYELCSVAMDLKLSEVVDDPNYVVSAYLPNDLFEERADSRLTPP